MRFKNSIPILYSENIQRSIDYYMNVLAFDSHWEWDDPPSFGGVSRGVVEIFFCEKGQGNPGTWICIMVDDINAYHDEIRSKGAKIITPPVDREWGLREMLVEDPDHHVLRFGQAISMPRHKQDSSSPSIRIVERRPIVEEYKELVRSVNWQVKPDSIIEKVLRSCLYAVVAEDTVTNKVIGCVLLIGDEASFYYVKDMMVMPAYHNHKLGTALMQKLADWLDIHAENDSLVGLYTAEGLAPFYRQFGFTEYFGMAKRIKR